MDYYLGYSEAVSDDGKGKPKALKFNRVYPVLSGTTVSQTTPRIPEGLTVVAFLEKGHVDMFNEVIEEIQNLNRNFRPVKNIHATLLGNFPDGVLNEQPVKNTINIFFQDKFRNDYEIDFDLNFNHIRLGNWGKSSDYNIVDASDGTVVAIGDLKYEGNREFVNLARELEAYLKKNLPLIFPNGFHRPFTTVWCTLGFFDCADFAIDKRFFNMFKKWTPLGDISASNILKVELVKHKFKSLNGYQSVLTFP